MDWVDWVDWALGRLCLNYSKCTGRVDRPVPRSPRIYEGSKYPANPSIPILRMPARLRLIPIVPDGNAQSRELPSSLTLEILCLVARRRRLILCRRHGIDCSLPAVHHQHTSFSLSVSRHSCACTWPLDARQSLEDSIEGCECE